MPSVTKVNQWKNTSVLRQLQKLPNKRKCTFISFNVVEFYSPISETLLEHARDFATNYVNISDDYHYIILEAKQSLLCNRNPQKKTNTNTLFNVTMGSYDGVKTCELIRIYILLQLKEKSYGIEIGLYRDDDLAVLHRTAQKIEKIKKEICKVFTTNNLHTKKVVNFLDVTLDLTTEKQKPYLKPSTTLRLQHVMYSLSHQLEIFLIFLYFLS